MTVRLMLNLDDHDYLELIRSKPRGVKKSTFAKMLVLEKLDEARLKQNAITQNVSENLFTGLTHNYTHENNFNLANH